MGKVTSLIILDSGGSIHCEFCDNWCEHLETAIKNHEDASLIWPEDSELREEFTLRVPMFPTSGLFTMVQLDRYEDFSIYRVRTGLEIEVVKRGVVPVPIKLKPLVFVCYLNRGEGLKVIRECLLQHMFATDWRNSQCTAKTHSVQAQVTWERNIRYSPYAECWCIFQNKVCITCFRYNPLLNQDDLVPGQERSGVWSKHV